MARTEMYSQIQIWQTKSSDIKGLEHLASGGKTRCSIEFATGPIDDGLPAIVFDLPESFVNSCASFLANNHGVILTFKNLVYKGVRGAENNQFHELQFDANGNSVVQTVLT